VDNHTILGSAAGRLQGKGENEADQTFTIQFVPENLVVANANLHMRRNREINALQFSVDLFQRRALPAGTAGRHRPHMQLSDTETVRQIHQTATAATTRKFDRCM
jgi:hypothetical protein